MLQKRKFTRLDRKRESERQQEDALKHEERARIISALDDIASLQGACNVKKARPQWLGKFNTFLTTGAVVIAAFFTASQWHVMSEQLNAMRDTLDEMKLEQRPWIFNKIEPSGPLVFDANGMSISLLFTLTNSGHLPASRVFIWPEIYLKYLDHDDLIGAAKKACLTHQSSTIKWGPDIPPGETVKRQITIIANADELKKGREIMAKHYKMPVASWNYIFPVVVGCTDYVFGQPSKHHQTPFILEIEKIDSLHPGMVKVINVDDGKVEPQYLHLNENIESIPSD